MSAFGGKRTLIECYRRDTRQQLDHLNANWGFRMKLKLHGKRALVTGASAGIGSAIAEVLAREGARVLVRGRNSARIRDVVLHCMSPLLAQSGHPNGVLRCLLSRAKRTLDRGGAMAPCEPKAT
jgi:3-oxoacyl-ACP reductase-like protein